MRFTNEWLKKHIETDADLPCEAGGLPRCATCDGLGEWDEGPLPAHSAATEPEYRQVKCPDCNGYVRP